MFNEFDVDEEEVAEAVDYYIKAGNLELKKIKEGIRKVFKMFGGDLGVDEKEEEEEEELGSGEAEDDDNYVDIDEEVGFLKNAYSLFSSQVYNLDYEYAINYIPYMIYQYQ